MNWILINCLVPLVSNAVAFPQMPPKNSFFPFISFCTKNTSLKKEEMVDGTHETKLKSSKRTR